MMARTHVLSPNDAALNEARVKALTAKYGDQTPYIAVAALGALTQFVPPEVLEEALMAAQVSVFVASNAGKVELLKDVEN